MEDLNFIDAIILLVILLGGVIGFKDGVIKRLTSVIGLVIVVILSFILKNYLSVFFYENLPFLSLWGIFKGVQVLNIIFYEVLAFIIVSSILMIVYRILLMVTGLLEKILKATIILSIPSKLLGFFVGIIENYIWVYLVLFVLTLPMFNISDIYNSKTAMFILKETPVLSRYTSKTVGIYQEIYDIIDNKGNKSTEQVNEEALDMMLKYEIITVESTDKLIEKNKIEINNKSFIDKYR